MASYTKLKDGSWGIRVVGAKPKKGQVVPVKKKSGENNNEIVAAVLWSGPDRSSGEQVSLCKIEPKSRSSSTPTRTTLSRSASRSRGCKTGGNCSSMGSGRGCGGHDCDGW